MIVDWQLLASKLRTVAPLNQISVEIGRHPDWLAHLARGEIEEPRFSYGIALLDYAADHLHVEELRMCKR